MKTIADVFAEVEHGDADYGVIPIENSTEGVVFHSMDRLVDSDLKICSQVYMPIEHCLVSSSELGLDSLRAFKGSGAGPMPGLVAAESSGCLFSGSR